MAHYSFERESGWIIVVGPGHEKGTGKHFDPQKSYLMKDAEELVEALQGAYDAGRLDTLNLMTGRALSADPTNRYNQICKNCGKRLGQHCGQCCPGEDPLKDSCPKFEAV